MKLFVNLVPAICVILGLGSVASAATLKLEGLRNNDGYIAVSVFAEKDRALYPEQGDQAAKTFYVKVGRLPFELEINHLPEGKYAISVMHDEDGDGKLKKGPMGIPKEGFGFSNNPKIFFGAPDFDKVLFQMNDDTVVKIVMKYKL